jgi:hypothetical protein
VPQIEIMDAGGIPVAWVGNRSATITEMTARIAALEALLREVDANVVFETAIHDGTGRDLQERIEQALGK